MSSNIQKGKAPAPLEADPVADRALTTDVISGRSEINTSGNSGNCDRIASSASSLLQSFLRPTASEARSTIQTAQQSKGQTPITMGGESSQYCWEDASSASRPHTQPFRDIDLPDEKNSMEFRSIPVTFTASTNEEFQNFSNELSQINSSTTYSEMTELLQNPWAQEDILQLLSSSTLTEAIWEPVSSPYLKGNAPTEAFRPDLQGLGFKEFLISEDIVEFLSREGTVYTEEVWGNMLELIQEAQKEVAESKGKGKEQSHDGNAVRRLKVIQGQLRSKL